MARGNNQGGQNRGSNQGQQSRKGKNSGNGGWFGDPEGHSQAAKKGRGGSGSSRNE